MKYTDWQEPLQEALVGAGQIEVCSGVRDKLGSALVVQRNQFFPKPPVQILSITGVMEVYVVVGPNFVGKIAGQATGLVAIPTLFIDRHCRSPRRYCQMPWRRQTIVSWR
jgi:hypothetical protein